MGLDLQECKGHIKCNSQPQVCFCGRTEIRKIEGQIPQFFSFKELSETRLPPGWVSQITFKGFSDCKCCGRIWFKIHVNNQSAVVERLLDEESSVPI